MGALLAAPVEIARQLDQGATLPAEWYTDPAIFRLEQDRIFRLA